MIIDLNNVLKMLLHRWLNGNIFKDFDLFELYVKLSKIFYDDNSS